MDRLQLFLPIIVAGSYFGLHLVAYSFLCLIGRRPPKIEKRERDNWFDFLIHYFNWMLGPLERLLLSLRLRPDHLTIMALFMCAGAGIAAATSHLATTFWLYIGAGALDVLDGRMARAHNQQTKAGAFLDSVTDRWGELFVLSGFAWLIHDSLWLLAALAAIIGSVMTSYTRARGESLGIELSGGFMQRGERIALVAIATLVTAYFDAASHTQEYGVHVIGIALALTGVGSIGTAMTRWVIGYRLLRAEDARDAELLHKDHVTKVA